MPFLSLLFQVGVVSITQAQVDWTKSRVTTEAAYDRVYPAIVIDSALNVHISYGDYDENTVRYATNTSGTYDAPTSVGKAYIGSVATSMASYPSSDRIHIVYSEIPIGDTTLCLTSTEGRDGAFGSSQIVRCDSSTWLAAPAVDAEGILHVAYQIGGDIYYQFRNSFGNWSSPVNVSHSPNELDVNPSLCVTPNGQVHIAYVSSALSSRYAVQYVRKEGDAFANPVRLISSTESIWWLSLALDSKARPHIVYSQRLSSTATIGVVYYMGYALAGGGWTTPEPITDASSFYNSVSIAVDKYDRLHVAANGYSLEAVVPNWEIIYLNNISGEWSKPANLTSNTVDDIAYNGGSHYLAIRDSLIAIAYHTREWGDRSEIAVLTTTLQPLPRISITPQTIGFGDVYTKRCVDTTLNIVNTRDDTLRIGPPILTGEGKQWMSVTPDVAEIVIGPGETAEINLRFCAEDAGILNAYILYSSSNLPGIFDTVVVTGRGIGPRLVILPDTITFPNVGAGSCLAAGFSLTNAGGDLLIVQPLQLAGQSPGDYRIDAPLGTTELGFLQSTGGQISFCPRDTGSFDALLIATAGSVSDTIALVGYALPPGADISPADTLNFGAIAASTCMDSTVTITNVGVGKLEVTSIGLLLSGAQEFTIPTTNPFSLETAEQHDIVIRFCPTDTGCFISRVIINTNIGPREVVLTGCAKLPVSLDYDTIDFGCTVEGDTPKRQVTIANAGTVSVWIDKFALRGGGAFEVPTATDIELLPDAIYVLELAYKPTIRPAVDVDTCVIFTSYGELNVALHGQASVKPQPVFSLETLDFGWVPTGSEKELCLTITNPSCLPLRASDVFVSGMRLTPSIPLPVPFVLDGGDSYQLCIRWEPSTIGLMTGSVHVVDSEGVEYETTVSGYGVKPGMNVIPSAIEYGTIDVGARSAAKRVGVVNYGAGPETVSFWEIGGVNPGDYSVTRFATPKVLRGNGVDTLWLDLYFIPQLAGPRSARLNVVYGTSQSITLDLIGTGISPGVEMSPLYIDFGETWKDATRTVNDTLVIINRGVNTVELRELVIDDNGAGVFNVPGFSPVVLFPGVPRKYTLTFSPNAVVQYTGQVIARLDNQSTIVATLLGKGIPNGQYSVFLDTVTANVGERFLMNVRVSPAMSANDNITGYSLRLRADRKALFLHGIREEYGSILSGAPYITRNANGTIQIEQTADPGASFTGDILASLQLEGLASGEPLNVVFLEDVAIKDAPVSPIIIGDGLVILNGCDVNNGLRLGRVAAIKAIRPQPATNDMVILTYTAPPHVIPVVRILDLTGTPVREYALEEGADGPRETSISMQGITSGAYILELRNGTERSSTIIVIAR